MEECVPCISDMADSNITAFVGGYGVFNYIKDNFTCPTNISFLGKQNRELYNDYLLTLAPSIIIPISVSSCHNKSEMSLLCNGSTSVFDGMIYDCYEIKENGGEYRCDTLAFSSTEFNVISEITVRHIMIDIYCTVCEMLHDRVCPEAIYAFDRDYDVSDFVDSITFDYVEAAVQHIKTREAEFSKPLNC